ncbi:MAG: conjugative transposon protein TraK [Sphingobacteriales bacterium]
MFRVMKNIDTAFRQVKHFTMAVIVACSLITCFALYKSFTLAEILRGKVYILSDGKALAALAADRKDNIGVEARDHIKTFHQLFFTLDPDDKVIQSNLTRALYLADASAKTAFDNLSESGYYANIIAGNISQRIQVDSIQVDLSAYPYRFHCFATQSIIRTTSTLTRSLVTRGDLRNVSRSDNNPHGFLIERWEITENKDLNSVNH